MDEDVSSSFIENNMIESIRSIVDNLEEQKDDDEHQKDFKKKTHGRAALNLKVLVMKLFPK